MIELNLLMIAVCCVCVIDIARFPDSLKRGIARWLGVKDVTLKPFDCSLCSSWWCGLIWMVCTSSLTLYGVMVCLLIACMTTEIASIIWMVKDLLVRLINKIG